MTFSSDAITDCVITSEGEQDLLTEDTKKAMAAGIVEGQSVDVDAVNGCTLVGSVGAIQVAVARCIAEASGEEYEEPEPTPVTGRVPGYCGPGDWLGEKPNITAYTKVASEDDADVVSFEVADGVVKGMKYGVCEGEVAFLDTFVVKRSLLLDMLDWYAANDHLDLFEAALTHGAPLTINTLAFDGYCAAIFNKMSYYRANMDMLNPETYAGLFPGGRHIKTKTHDTPPAKNEIGSKVTKSLVSSGSRIYGTVEGSVLSRNVIVEPGAVVTDSVIMQGTIVKSGAVVDHAIVDRNNVIPSGTVIKGTDEEVITIEKARA